VHFAAGPWFTVRDETSDDWEELGRVWLSDGAQSGPGRLLYRVRLDNPDTFMEL